MEQPPAKQDYIVYLIAIGAIIAILIVLSRR